MAHTQYQHMITAPASGDIHASFLCFGSINASGQVAVTGAGARVDGVINTDTASAQGAPVELVVAGLTKVTFAGAVNPGAEVMSNAAGKAVAATAGNYVAGIYTGLAAAAANDVGPILIYRYKI